MKLIDRRYRDEILTPTVISSSAAIGNNFMLMDSNYRPHHANLVNDFMFIDSILQRQINLEVDSHHVKELLKSHNQELTIDELIEMHEQDIEELESLNPFQ
ncbi:hypothetical protein TNCV_3146781 [Trichonephila clavipes]|nr:hypothetical protein TNCV_3146781 [Trichonephila clavipes]